MDRWYLIPKDVCGPKYLTGASPHDRHGEIVIDGTRCSAFMCMAGDGLNNANLVLIRDVTPQLHNELSSMPDVWDFPRDLTRTVGAAQRPLLRQWMRDHGLPLSKIDTDGPPTFKEIIDRIMDGIYHEQDELGTVSHNVDALTQIQQLTAMIEVELDLGKRNRMRRKRRHLRNRYPRAPRTAQRVRDDMDLVRLRALSGD